MCDFIRRMAKNTEIHWSLHVLNRYFYAIMQIRFTGSVQFEHTTTIQDDKDLLMLSLKLLT
jgi:hypothetical protein